MIRAKIAALCGAVLVCGLAFAQSQTESATPPEPPSPAQHVAHQISFLTQTLSLTSEQQSKASAIFTNAETSMSSLRSSLDTAHKALESAIESNDTAAITTASETIGKLTAQQTQIHANAQAAFLAILTPEQQTKAKALHAGGPRGFGRGGGERGGPPPGPPAQ